MVRRCAIMENRRYVSTITPENIQLYRHGSTRVAFHGTEYENIGIPWNGIFDFLFQLFSMENTRIQVEYKI